MENLGFKHAFSKGIHISLLRLFGEKKKNLYQMDLFFKWNFKEDLNFDMYAGTFKQFDDKKAS